jgi:hypothetical protein
MSTIVADSDEIAALATQLRLAGNFAGHAAASVHSGIGLADLGLAALLDPGGAGRFEVAALDVLTGPCGLAGLEAAFDHVGASLKRAASDYLDVDGARLSVDALSFVRDLPKALWATGSALREGHWADVPQAFATSEPSMTDAVSHEARPLIDLVGRLPWGDTPVVTRVPEPAISQNAPPRDLRDVFANLASVDDSHTQGQGGIEIQILTGTDAAGKPDRKVVVYLPGTDSWDPRHGSDVNDILASVPALAGARTTYENGVLAALHKAGITAADDVTLVGHSQGGVVAINTARDAARLGEFNVTHVITAGAPIGNVVREVPASTQVLAVENHGDLVPDTDGTENPHRANVLTVPVDHDHGEVVANHDLKQSYVPGAVDLDNEAAIDSTDAEIKLRGYLDSEGDLFSLTGLTTQHFSITSK